MFQLYVVEGLMATTVNEENYHIAALISSLNFKKNQRDINSAVNFNTIQQLWEISA